MAGAKILTLFDEVLNIGRENSFLKKFLSEEAKGIKWK